MFAHFNNHQFRRYLVAFGSLFNNVVVSREDSANTEVQRLVVPLEYGPKDRWYLRLAQDPSFLQGISQILPRMTYEVTSINYDTSRKLNTMNQLIFPTDDLRKRAQTYVGVPYTLSIQLDILTKLQQDGFQIVEQILPYFTPDLNFAVNVVPELGLVDTVPVTLISVTHADNYEGDFMKRRNVLWSLAFTMKVNFYGARRKQSRIEEVMVDIHDAGIVGLDDAENIVTEVGLDQFMLESGEQFVSEATPDVYTQDDKLVSIDVKLDPLDQDPSANPTLNTTITEFTDAAPFNYVQSIKSIVPAPNHFWRLGDATVLGPQDEMRTTQDAGRFFSANTVLQVAGITAVDNDPSVYFTSTGYAVGTSSSSFLPTTCCVWVYPVTGAAANFGAGRTILCTFNDYFGSFSNKGFWFGLSGSDSALTPKIYWQENGGQTLLTGNAIIPLETWTHIAYVRTGTVGRFYINGQLDVESSFSFIPTKLPIRIGGIGVAGPSGFDVQNSGFGGRLDEIVAWDTSLLTDNQIRTIYTNTLRRS